MWQYTPIINPIIIIPSYPICHCAPPPKKCKINKEKTIINDKGSTSQTKISNKVTCKPDKAALKLKTSVLITKNKTEIKEKCKERNHHKSGEKGNLKRSLNSGNSNSSDISAAKKIKREIEMKQISDKMKNKKKQSLDKAIETNINKISLKTNPSLLKDKLSIKNNKKSLNKSASTNSTKSTTNKTMHKLKTINDSECRKKIKIEKSESCHEPKPVNIKINVKQDKSYTFISNDKNNTPNATKKDSNKYDKNSGCLDLSFLDDFDVDEIIKSLNDNNDDTKVLPNFSIDNDNKSESLDDIMNFIEDNISNKNKIKHKAKKAIPNSTVNEQKKLQPSKKLKSTKYLAMCDKNNKDIKEYNKLLSYKTDNTIQKQNSKEIKSIVNNKKKVNKLKHIILGEKPSELYQKKENKQLNKTASERKIHAIDIENDNIKKNNGVKKNKIKSLINVLKTTKSVDSLHNIQIKHDDILTKDLSEKNITKLCQKKVSKQYKKTIDVPHAIDTNNSNNINWNKNDKNKHIKEILKTEKPSDLTNYNTQIDLQASTVTSNLNVKDLKYSESQHKNYTKENITILKSHSKRTDGKQSINKKQIKEKLMYSDNNSITERPKKNCTKDNTISSKLPCTDTQFSVVCNIKSNLPPTKLRHNEMSRSKFNNNLVNIDILKNIVKDNKEMLKKGLVTSNVSKEIRKTNEKLDLKNNKEEILESNDLQNTIKYNKETNKHDYTKLEKQTKDKDILQISIKKDSNHTNSDSNNINNGEHCKGKSDEVIKKKIPKTSIKNLEPLNEEIVDIKNKILQATSSNIENVIAVSKNYKIQNQVNQSNIKNDNFPTNNGKEEMHINSNGNYIINSNYSKKKSGESIICETNQNPLNLPSLQEKTEMKDVKNLNKSKISVSQNETNKSCNTDVISTINTEQESQRDNNNKVIDENNQQIEIESKKEGIANTRNTITNIVAMSQNVVNEDQNIQSHKTSDNWPPNKNIKEEPKHKNTIVKNSEIMPEKSIGTIKNNNIKIQTSTACIKGSNVPQNSKYNLLNNNQSKPLNLSSLEDKTPEITDEKNTPTSDNLNKNDSLKPNNFTIHLEKELCRYMKKQFKVLGMIHKGMYSKLFKCRNEKGEDVAIKVLQPNHEITKGYNKEKMLLEIQKDVPKNKFNCIKIFDGFLFFTSWCIFMEYYPKNLKEALKENEKGFHIDLIQDLSRQLVTAVTILRNNNIIHSDIKPSHILLNSTNTILKLGGFDDACYVKDMNIVPYIGTAQYRAPEVILVYSTSYSIDVWSTACVLYEMATNKCLFSGTNNSEIFHQQINLLDDGDTNNLSSFSKLCITRKMRMARFSQIQFDNDKKDKKSLNGLVTETYVRNWGQNEKLEVFIELLSKMLVLDPKNRLGIEFVFVNPFVYA